MKKNYWSLLGTVVLVGLVGCSSGPSQAFLDQFKKDQAGTELPEIQVRLGQVIEEKGFPGGGESCLHSAMSTLGNQMGFRIEASKGSDRFFQITRYTLVDLKDPGLPGLSIVREGDLVRIRPDYKKDIVIESALPPKEGFEKMMASKSTAQDKEMAAATLTLLGDKHPKDTLAKLEAKDKDDKEKMQAAFDTNVQRVCKDNGYKKAWLVVFRRRQLSALPAESPFWSLAENVHRIHNVKQIIENPAFLRVADFWWAHGKEDTKATLATFAVVAFQDKSGNLAKVAGWQDFKGE